MIIQDDAVCSELWAKKGAEKEKSENLYDNAYVAKELKFTECPGINRDITLSLLRRSFRVSQ